MTLRRTAFLRKPPDADRLTVPVRKEAKRRTRKCAIAECRQPFELRSMTHKVCSPACGMAFIEIERHKKERRERQAGLQKLKRRADHMKEAQTALNAWIRARDAALPCISCGRHHTGQYHAGHFLARGSHPHLALVEANLAKQCMPCNVHLSGNQLEFRKGLIARIGLEAVEALEADNTSRKPTIDELQELKAHYRAKLKALTTKT